MKKEKIISNTNNHIQSNLFMTNVQMTKSGLLFPTQKLFFSNVLLSFNYHVFNLFIFLTIIVLFSPIIPFHVLWSLFTPADKSSWHSSQTPGRPLIPVGDLFFYHKFIICHDTKGDLVSHVELPNTPQQWRRPACGIHHKVVIFQSFRRNVLLQNMV